MYVAPGIAIQYPVMPWLEMMILDERAVGVRDKSVLLVFGQTAMFF